MSRPRLVEWVVTGRFRVNGTEPGGRFLAPVTPARLALVKGGHIARAPRRPASTPGSKPKRPRGARKPNNGEE